MQQAGVSYSGMREQVADFIKACPCCQKISDLKPIIHTSPYVTSNTEPIRRLNIDTISPLPPDDRGNKFVIVIIDTFSRYVTLHAVKDVSGKEAARALLKHICTYCIASRSESNLDRGM